MKSRFLPRFWSPAGMILLIGQPAFATQAHSAPEGLYAHQLDHIFFIISMGVLIYWLRARQLVKVVGWRHINRLYETIQMVAKTDLTVLITGESGTGKEKKLKEFNHRFIGRLLEANNGNVSRAARQCGMERQALQQIMRRYGIKADIYRK